MNNTIAEMLDLLAENKDNPQVFQQLIQEFAEYFNNTGVSVGSIESKIKQAEDNWQPKGV